MELITSNNRHRKYSVLKKHNGLLIGYLELHMKNNVNVVEMESLISSNKKYTIYEEINSMMIHKINFKEMIKSNLLKIEKEKVRFVKMREVMNLIKENEENSLIS